MASRSSLPICFGRSRGHKLIDQLHKHPDQQGPTIRPRPAVNVHEPLAVLKRRIIQRDPIEHLKIRELLYLTRWNTQSIPSTKTEQPNGHQEHLPVRLPPLESTTNYVASSPGEEDLNDQSQLTRFPVFALFKMWKPFYIWHTKVRAKRFHLARDFIKNNLFAVSQSLSPALLDIRDMCYETGHIGMCRMEEKHTYTLKEFRDVQIQQLQEVLTDLEKYRQLVKDVTVCACRNYLSDRSKFDVPDDQEGWKIVARIQKVAHCNHLARFIRLVDYLVVNSLHKLVVTAVTQLLAVLQDVVSQTPSHATIRSWSQPSESITDPTEEDTEKKTETPQVKPLFTSELKLDADVLKYNPSEENFQETIAEIIGRFEKTVMSVQTLTADTGVDFMAETGIYKTLENKYDGGPCLKSIIYNDGNLKTLIKNVKELLQFAFDSARVYSDTFERLRLHYTDNESLDLDEVRQQDHGVAFFVEALRLYHGEHREALAIQEKRYLGLLIVEKAQLKEKFVSSPLRCLEVINEILPQLAKKKVAAAVAEARESEFKIHATPTNTTDFAKFLTFLDFMLERITALDEEQEAVSEMYNLIEMYSVPMAPEDMYVFPTMQLYINSLQKAVCKAELGRKPSLDKFFRYLNKDMKQLNKDVLKIKLKLLDSQVLDHDGDPTEVQTLLEEIQVSLAEVQARGSTYTSYMKKFKREQTEFDALEELSALFYLTQILWDSLEELDYLQDGWKQSTLAELDLENLNSQVTKYCEYVIKLENGLPRNTIVSSFKEKVEVVRHKLSVITELCNPHLEPKHWMTLESIIGTTLNVEELTMTDLEEIKVFSYAAEIQEVSKQASEEAELEETVFTD